MNTWHGSKYASESQMQCLFYNTDDDTALPSKEIQVISTKWTT